LSQNPQRLIRETVDIEEIGQQSVLLMPDHLAHGSGVGSHDDTLAGHCVQHGPRKNEGHGQIDVNVADRKDVDEFGLRNGSEKTKSRQVRLLLKKNVFAVRFRLDVFFIVAVVDTIRSDNHEKDI